MSADSDAASTMSLPASPPATSPVEDPAPAGGRLQRQHQRQPETALPQPEEQPPQEVGSGKEGVSAMAALAALYAAEEAAAAAESPKPAAAAQRQRQQPSARQPDARHSIFRQPDGGGGEEIASPRSPGARGDVDTAALRQRHAEMAEQVLHLCCFNNSEAPTAMCRHRLPVDERGIQ